MHKQKILFYAPILEYPAAGGPQISVLNAIKALGSVSELYVLTPVSEQNREGYKSDLFFKEYVFKFVQCYFSEVKFSFGLKTKIKNIFRRLFSVIFGLVYAIQIVSITNRYGIRVVWIDRILEHSFFVFLFLKLFSNNLHIVADTEAVHSEFIKRELPLIRNIFRYVFVSFHGQVAYIHECILKKYADVITVVSSRDKTHFMKLNGNATVMLFTNVVDLGNYRKKTSIETQMKGKAICLIGSFGRPNSPMDMAAAWLIDDIMGKVWEKHHDANVYIIGRNSDKTQKSRESSKVHILGSVENMSDYLCQASVIVVPLFYESGTRFKILEAGAMELPCVSTSLGAEGINVRHNHDILIADTEEDFANCINDVLGSASLSKKLGKNLGKLIEKHYSITTQINDAVVILRNLRNEKIIHEQ